MLYPANYSCYAAAPDTITPTVTRRVSHTVVEGRRFVCVHTGDRRWIGYFVAGDYTDDLTAETRKDLLSEARATLKLRGVR